jgi:hypothetical protein
MYSSMVSIAALCMLSGFTTAFPLLEKRADLVPVISTDVCVSNFLLLPARLPEREGEGGREREGEAER